jgi:hypothetical protein
LPPEWLTARAPLRGLLTGAVASTVFLAETVVMAVATDGGYALMLLTLLATPVAGVTAAAYSGDVLGRCAVTRGCGAEGSLVEGRSF